MGRCMGSVKVRVMCRVNFSDFMDRVSVKMCI